MIAHMAPLALQDCLNNDLLNIFALLLFFLQHFFEMFFEGVFHLGNKFDVEICEVEEKTVDLLSRNTNRHLVILRLVAYDCIAQTLDAR